MTLIVEIIKDLQWEESKKGHQIQRLENSKKYRKPMELSKKVHLHLTKVNGKYNRPPDLSKFKAKNIQTLENKQSKAHETLAKKLMNEDARKVDM